MTSSAEAPTTLTRPAVLLPAASLWHREVVTFFRARSRVTGAIAFPFMMWLLLGSGFSASFRPESAAGDIGYLEYFFPGAIVLVVVFTAIFSPATLIDDRKAGFLQSVLVAPVSRMSIVLGKILGSTTLALTQGLLFLILAQFIGISITPTTVLAVSAALVLMAFWVTALGFLVAWRIESTPGFHALMNMVLMPLWFLSGAVFPAAGGPVWIRTAMAANPLTYGVALLRHAFYGSSVSGDVPSLALSLGVTVVCCVLTLWGATRLVTRRTPLA